MNFIIPPKESLKMLIFLSNPNLLKHLLDITRNGKLYTNQLAKFIKLIFLHSKKCDGQVREKYISVPVMCTILAVLLGTNSGVALQCAGISETSSQDLLNA